MEINPHRDSAVRLQIPEEQGRSRTLAERKVGEASHKASRIQTAKVSPCWESDNSRVVAPASEETRLPTAQFCLFVLSNSMLSPSFLFLFSLFIGTNHYKLHKYIFFKFKPSVRGSRHLQTWKPAHAWPCLTRGSNHHNTIITCFPSSD